MLSKVTTVLSDMGVCILPSMPVFSACSFFYYSLALVRFFSFVLSTVFIQLTSFYQQHFWTFHHGFPHRPTRYSCRLWWFACPSYRFWFSGFASPVLCNHTTSVLLIDTILVHCLLQPYYRTFVTAGAVLFQRLPSSLTNLFSSVDLRSVVSQHTFIAVVAFVVSCFVSGYLNDALNLLTLH